MSKYYDFRGRVRIEDMKENASQEDAEILLKEYLGSRFPGTSDLLDPRRITTKPIYINMAKESYRQGYFQLKIPGDLIQDNPHEFINSVYKKYTSPGIPYLEYLALVE